MAETGNAQEGDGSHDRVAASLDLSQIVPSLQTHLSRGDIPQACELLSGAISQEPTNPLFYLLLAKISAAAMNGDVLNWVLQKAEETRLSNDEVYLQISSAYYALGQTNLAVAALATGLRYCPQSTPLLFNLASNALREQDTLLAENYLNAIVAVSPQSIDAWIGIAAVCLNGGQLDRALSALLKVKELNHAHADFLPLAQALVERMPNNRDAWFCLGTAHSFSTSVSHYDYSKAEAAFQKAVDIGPDSEEIFSMFGNVYGFQSRWDMAMPNYTRACELRDRKSAELGLDQLGIRFLGPDFTRAIGHQTTIDMFLKMEKLGLLPHARTMVFPADAVANPHYLTYFEQHVRILNAEERRVWEPIRPYLEEHFDCFRLADGRYVHNVMLIGLVQKMWEEQKREPLLMLRDDDRKRGWDVLEKLGVPRNNWFAVVHVRETGIGPDGQWLPCGENRNAHIEAYAKTMKWVVEQGGWVIRIGSNSMKELSASPHVIDLAHSPHRADWMDVFLLAECEFLIGTASGPIFVPTTFGKNVVSTDWFTLEELPPSGNDLFIPKLIWSESEKRLLKFSEMIADWRLRYTDVYVLKQLGLQLVDNSEDEILEVTAEMYRRLHGQEHDTAEDIALQAKFRESIGANEFTSAVRIGKAFLAKYAHLLGPGVM